MPRTFVSIRGAGVSALAVVLLSVATGCASKEQKALEQAKTQAVATGTLPELLLASPEMRAAPDSIC